MPLSYPKLVRGVFLIAFSCSSIISCLQFHTNAVVIAALSLIGFIAFDIVCYLKDKNKPAPAVIDPRVDQLQAKYGELEAKFNTVTNDAGLAKLAASYRR